MRTIIEKCPKCKSLNTSILSTEDLTKVYGHCNDCGWDSKPRNENGKVEPKTFREAMSIGISPDDKWLIGVKKIKDPIEMLKCICENEEYLGYDSYYKQFREAMLNQADKIVKGKK